MKKKKVEKEDNIFSDELKEKLLKEENNIKMKKLELFSKKKKTKLISYSTINLFYEDPISFFKKEKELLSKTTFYDFCGNSIFSHYFYVLYEKWNKNNKKIFDEKNNDIYEQNFDSFFLEHKSNLIKKDEILDTPLHKLLKIRNKKFFFEICKRLKEIGVLDVEILLLKNKNEESFFDYIYKEIKDNYGLIIKKNEYNIYKEFLSLFPSLIESLTNIEKETIIYFNFGIFFQHVKFSENNFAKIYKDIINLVKNNNCSSLLFSFKCGINYLNYLFHLCNTNNDYDNLLNLIINNYDKEGYFDKIIYDHIGYILRKMNSTKRRGDKEINYANNLINSVLQNSLKNKNKKEIYSILFNRKIIINKKKFNIFKEGIIYNLLYNSNLDFNIKTQFLDNLKKITNIDLEKVICHDFINIYKFFKLIYKINITIDNINDILKENKFIIDIFAFFLPYINLYKLAFLLWYNSGIIVNSSEFINLVNKFMENKYPKYINNYKTRYGLTNELIKKILEIISLYSEHNYTKENEEFKGNEIYAIIEKQIDYKKFYLEFILMDEQLIQCYLKYFLGKGSQYKYFDVIIDLIFNCKYDLTKVVNERNRTIIDIIESHFRVMHIDDKINLKPINHFLPTLMKNKNDINFILDNSPKEIFNAIKDFPIPCYQFFFFLSDYFHNINILSNKDYDFRFNLKLLIRKNILYLIKEWDKPYDYSELLDTIETNILSFCRILINNSCESLEENILKINFFFDLIYELKPENKNKFDDYKNMTINYISYVSSDYGFQALDSQTLNYFYLLLINLYIKKKFGDYNPELLFLFSHFYEGHINIFLMFIKCIKENGNLNEIKNHFFISKFQNNAAYIKFINKYRNCYNYPLFGDISKNALLDNIKNYFEKYLSDLTEIKYSLVFEYITSLLTDYGKYQNERYYLIPSIMLNLGQNEYIKNLLLQRILSSEITFYEFLKEKYDPKNENKIRKIIHFFSKIPKNENIKSYFIYQDIYNNKSLIYNKLIEKNILFNLYALFQALKKKSITLYDCVNSNFIILKDSINLIIHTLSKYCFNFYFGKNEKEKINFIKEESYDFLLSFFFLYKNNDNNIDELKKRICRELSLEIFLTAFYSKIIQLNNKYSINIEYDKFIKFIKFYFGIFVKEENNEPNIYIHFHQKIKPIINFLTEKNPEKCIDFVKFISPYFSKNKSDLYLNIYNNIINIVCKDPEKYNQYIPNYLSLIEENFSSKNSILFHRKNVMISFLLRNTKYNNLGIMNYYTDIEKLNKLYYSILNDTKNKELSSYLLLKIRNSMLMQNDEKILLEIFENGIKNKYIFDNIFSSLSENRQKLFFEENKNIIIKSLFLYGQKNEYIFIQKIMKYLNKYMPINEINKIVYPLKDIEEEITKSINYLEENIDDNYFKSKEKYLFYFCQTKRTNLNYETLAILFDYCPKANAIFDLCPFINNSFTDKDKAIKNKKILNYLSYFKIEKNRMLIRSLSSSFYNFSLLLEIFIKHIINEKENNMESIILLYYIKIDILETTPEELLAFFDCEINEPMPDYQNYEEWFLGELLNRKKARKINEKFLFIIFALYELKGLPIIPIKKYLPEFYWKIEFYFKKFKRLNIQNCCIKKPFDIKIYDKIRFLIKNKTTKLLKDLYEKYSLFNLIFIIEKENNLISKLSNENNYLEKVLYNLVENNEIESQIPDNKYKEYMISLIKSFGYSEIEEEGSFNSTLNTERKVNNLFEDDNNIILPTLIKDCILTLKNFNLNASILIEQCSQKRNSSDKYNYFIEFKCYLRIILSICNHILFKNTISKEDNINHILFENIISKENNKNHILFENTISKENNKNHILFENTISKENNKNYKLFLGEINLFNIFKIYNEKFKLMKNTIDIKQINYLILSKYGRGEEINILGKTYLIFSDDEFQNKKDRNNFFTFIKGWMDNYFRTKEISKLFNDLNNEEFSYLTYFKFLKYTCFIILEFLRKLEDMDYIKLYDIKCEKKIQPLNLNFVVEKDKNKAKDILRKSLKNLGDEIIQKIEIKEENIKYETQITFCYYFNEEKKDFVETSSDIIILEFIKNKIFSLFSFIYKLYEADLIYEKDKIHLLIYFNNKLNDNKISSITSFLMPSYCNYSKINNILRLFNFEEYKNIISTYIEKTAENINEPKIEYSVYNYFYNLYFDFLYPPLYFNQNLSKYCQDLRFFEEDKKFEIFIDFYELIKAIKETNFHENPDLNKYFQKCAIYYIINNNDSLIYIFINELYKFIRDEMIFRGDKNIIIKNKFKIIVKKGFNYSSERIKLNINKIQNNNEIKENKLNENNKNNINIINNNIKEKEKKIFQNADTGIKKKKMKLKLKPNTKIVFKNFYKRKNIPILNYSGYIPRNENYVGMTQGFLMSTIFGNEILIENKSVKNKLELLGKDEKKKFGKKKEYKKDENLINIFDLIFKIGSINKKEIILKQYDISKILEPYVEKNKFLYLINRSFNNKTKVEIPENWNKIINLELIYSKLGYVFFEKYNNSKEVGIIKLNKNY